jgi:hypothetical protein
MASVGAVARVPADDAAARQRITVLVESRDAYTFAACCWFLHRLDPAAEAVLAALNPRDPHACRLVLLAHAPSSSVWYKSAQLDYGVETTEPMCTDTRPEPFRRLRLRGERAHLTSFVAEALDVYRARVTARWAGDEEGVPCWTWDEDCGLWSRGRTRRPRPLSTLFLPPDAEHLVADFRVFCSDASLERYRELHVAPTRVYMLHGLPGSGKSTMIHCVASEMRYGVATLGFSPSTTDADLKAALGALPPRCVLCIEDIDGLFAEGRRVAPGNGVTFAGLLAALDGCAGLEEGAGTGVFLTTNRFCTLDPALRRRIDYVLEFGFATKGQAQRMFAQFFPHSTAFEQLWQRLYGRQFAMSVLQKYLLKALQAGDPLEHFDQFEALAQCAAADGAFDGGHMYA